MQDRCRQHLELYENSHAAVLCTLCQPCCQRCTEEIRPQTLRLATTETQSVKKRGANCGSATEARLPIPLHNPRVRVPQTSQSGEGRMIEQLYNIDTPGASHCTPPSSRPHEGNRMPCQKD